MHELNKPRRRLIRIAEVSKLTGLSRATIYRMMADKQFPKQIMLTERSVGWDEDEIQDWITLKLRVGGKLIPEIGDALPF